MTEAERLRDALDAFKAKQAADHRAFLKANPEFAADMKQAVSYDAALRRQAPLNGLPVPAHRRA